MAGESAPLPPLTGEPTPRPAALDEARVIQALKANRWSMNRAARQLGVPRSSLYDFVNRSRRIRKARDLEAPEILRHLRSSAGDVDMAAEQLEVSPRGLRLRIRELGLERKSPDRK